MSKFQTIYGKVRSELVILGGSIMAGIGLVAALTTGTVHAVAQDALPIAALVIAVVTRNRVFSAATVADLIATAKSIAALKAAKPDPLAFAGAPLPPWTASPVPRVDQNLSVATTTDVIAVDTSAPVPPAAPAQNLASPAPVVAPPPPLGPPIPVGTPPEPPAPSAVPPPTSVPSPEPPVVASPPVPPPAS